MYIYIALTNEVVSEALEFQQSCLRMAVLLQWAVSLILLGYLIVPVLYNVLPWLSLYI